MKRWVWNSFWFVLVALVLYWAFKDIDFYEVYLILTYANLTYIGLAILVTGLTFFIWALRWTFVSGNLFKGDFWFLLNVLLAGAFFNSVTGGAGVGGEPFRAHFLAKRYKRNRTSMLAYVLADKFYQLVVLVVFAIFSIFFVFVFVNISNTLTYILEATLFFITLFLGAAIYIIVRRSNFSIGKFVKKLHFLRFFKKRFKNASEFEEFINKHSKLFMNVFKKSVKNRKIMFEAFFLSFIFWIFNYLAAYFLFLAFKMEVNFLVIIIVVTLGNLIGSFALVPGGVAITEVTMTLLFAAMGIDIAFAFIVSLLVRLIYYFFSLPIGAFSLWYIKKITQDKDKEV